MTPIIYYYKFRYYRMATRPAATGEHVVYEEKGEDQRYWQQSTEELFEQAQYYGKRVSKTVRPTKALQS
jgi:hypothetical protein